MKEINLNDWELIRAIPSRSNQPHSLYLIKNIYIGIWYNIWVNKQTGNIRINHTYSNDKVKDKYIKLITDAFNLWMKLKRMVE